MTTYFSRKDVEEIKPQVDKTIEKFLGFHEPDLVTTALNCLSSGYDKQKTTGMLFNLCYLCFKIIVSLTNKHC